MQDRRDLRPAPGLIGAHAADDVRNQETGIGIPTVGGSGSSDLEGIVGGKGLEAPNCGTEADILNRMFEIRGILQRDGRRQAVAQLLRVSVGEDADTAVILVEEVGLMAVFRRVEEVVERCRLAKSEATPLDEGAQQIGVAVRRIRWACCTTGCTNSRAREAQRRGVVGGVLPAAGEVCA